LLLNEQNINLSNTYGMHTIFLSEKLMILKNV